MSAKSISTSSSPTNGGIGIGFGSRNAANVSATPSPEKKPKRFDIRKYTVGIVLVAVLATFCGGSSYTAFLHFLFAFFVGVFVTLCAILIGINLLLESALYEAKEDKEKVIKEAEELKILFSRKHTFSDTESADLQSWAKIFPGSPPQDSKSKDFTFIILKSNLLFEFRNEKDTECLGVMSLDKSIVSIEMTKKNVTRNDRWHKKNGIRIEKQPNNPLVLNGGTEIVFLYLPSARALHIWYLAICKAAKLVSTTADDLLDDKREKDHFINMRENLLSELDNVEQVSQNCVNATWFNAMMGRMFWNYHNTKQLSNLFKRKIATKLAAINPPSIVDKIEIEEFSLGPNLPMINNVTLAHVSSSGAMKINCDVNYHGGAHLTIKILMSVNYLSISIPVTISFTLKSLSGKLQWSCSPPPSDTFWMGFHSEPTVELEVHTEIGKNSKIYDFPALARIIIEKLKTKLIQTMVLPNMDDYQFIKEDEEASLAEVHFHEEKPVPNSFDFPIATPASNSFTTLPSIDSFVHVEESGAKRRSRSTSLPPDSENEVQPTPSKSGQNGIASSPPSSATTSTSSTPMPSQSTSASSLKNPTKIQSIPATKPHINSGVPEAMSESALASLPTPGTSPTESGLFNFFKSPFK